MKYALDTNICIALLRGQSERLQGKVEGIATNLVALPVIVVFELFFEVFRSQRRQANFARISDFVTSFARLDFTGEDAVAAARTRAELSAAGDTIGPYDILVAAQAQTRDLILVTGNRREFARVRGLRIENWLD